MISARTSIAVAALVCVCSACSFSMGNLTAASTKNVAIRSTVIKQGVEGTDCTRSILLFIPISSLTVSFQEAADRALATVPGSNALTNIALYNEPLIFILYNQVCLRVRGDAIKIETGEEVQP